MCRVNWCNDSPEKYLNGNSKDFCTFHMQYRKWVTNAPSRMWLFYKLEKLLVGDFKCEICGVDKQKQHPTRTIKQIIQCLDIDHIDDSLKGMFKGEQPENYQQLCSDCHTFKSDENGDCNNQKNKKYKSKVIKDIPGFEGTMDALDKIKLAYENI